MRGRIGAIALFAVLLAAVPVLLPAQANPDSTCAYTRCALGIAPVWNGLAVVRGTERQRVANLGFFFPRDVAPAFAGEDSALRHARRAVRVRRWAALFTDAGGALLGYGAVQQIRNGRLARSERAAAALGGASLAVSVPLQFGADGLLSRAVWWYNRRYARRSGEGDGGR